MVVRVLLVRCCSVETWVFPYANKDTYSKKRAIEESVIFVVSPTWDSFQNAIKEQYYHVGSYEEHYIKWTTYARKWTRQYQISPIFSIPCTPNWVSKTLSDIRYSNTTIFWIDTFKQKWIFCTSHHWVRIIDMLSRSSINLRRIGESLDLQTPPS
jgi:hypothetical protein